MTGYYGRNSPKLKSENIRITPTKSPVGNHNSMIRKYLRSDNDENQFSSPKLSRPMKNASRSPLSSVENIPISPMKVEDDVVVMDAFVINASKRNAGSGGKIRPSVNSDSSRKSSTGSNSDSGRNSGGSSGYQMEKCHFWEKSGKCRYGSKCQYPHGQEELSPLGSRLNNRNSLEPFIRQPYLSPQSSNNSPINTFAVGNVRSASSVSAKAISNLYRSSPSPSPSPSSNHSTVSALTSTYHSAVSVLPSPSPSPNRSVFSARSSPNHSAVSVLTSPYHSAVSVLPSPSPSPSPSPLPSPNHSMVSALPSPNHSTISALASPKGPSTDWSPLDDAINASDPMPREDVDHYIHKVLYGPLQSKRLPVFVDICPDCNSLALLSLHSKV